jgi:hypothetical protein
MIWIANATGVTGAMVIGVPKLGCARRIDLAPPPSGEPPPGVVQVRQN